MQADKFLEMFQRNPDRMKRIADDGRSQGTIHHLVAAKDDGTVMVVDEWDSRESCERFLANQEDIKAVMGEFELSGQPIVRSYRVLDTPDRF
jgi:heme-degrading monooxygenase HmoA